MAEKNAKLIAAAPELLRLLEEAYYQLRNDYNDTRWDYMLEAVNKAKGAPLRSFDIEGVVEIPMYTTVEARTGREARQMAKEEFMKLAQVLSTQNMGSSFTLNIL